MDVKQSVTTVMSSEVLSITLDQPVSAARRLMFEHQLHHVPVVEDRRLVGLISMSDILGLSYTEFEGSTPRDSLLDERCTTESLMTRDLVTLERDATIADAATALADGRFHSVPVVDDAGALVGLVTTTDLIRCIASAG